MLDSRIKIVKPESCVLVCVWVKRGYKILKAPIKQVLEGVKIMKVINILKKHLPKPEKAFDLALNYIFCFIHIIIRWISAEGW